MDKKMINKEITEEKEREILIMFDVIVKLTKLADHIYYNKKIEIIKEKAIREIELIQYIVTSLGLDDKSISERLNLVKELLRKANNIDEMYFTYLELETIIIRLSNSFAKYIITKY